eukprot:TRINITY_DN12326_c3_g1_i10.p1 TRINITY_DN12326_c3_g1~~TRINITY_DN12326_c3_g1_i10.p1  ORF type:complete len:515 (+),score=125.08 TRINITY_DN12326_c3_g1_i10:47-1591(+)
MSYAPRQLSPPEGLEELIWSFAKEVLRKQPENIYKFGAEYFRGLIDPQDPTTGVEEQSTVITDHRDDTASVSVTETPSQPVVAPQDRRDITTADVETSTAESSSSQKSPPVATIETSGTDTNTQVIESPNAIEETPKTLPEQPNEFTSAPDVNEKPALQPVNTEHIVDVPSQISPSEEMAGDGTTESHSEEDSDAPGSAQTEPHSEANVTATTKPATFESIEDPTQGSTSSSQFDINRLVEAVAPDEANKDLLKAIDSTDAIDSLWNQADFNGNGGCSLAELDKMVEEKGWPLSKPTLMRAYKKTTLKDGDGDAWVEKKEFAAFLQNAFFFERLWDVFEDLDGDDDRRIEVDEFKAGMGKLGCALSDEEAQAEFAKIDTNGGGKVLFKEFCVYVAKAVGVDLEADNAKWQDDKSRVAPAAEANMTQGYGKRDPPMLACKLTCTISWMRDCQPASVWVSLSVTSLRLGVPGTVDVFVCQAVWMSSRQVLNLMACCTDDVYLHSRCGQAAGGSCAR